MGEDDRGNLNLHTDTAGINVDVHVVGQSTSPRAFLRASSSRGSIRFKLMKNGDQNCSVECRSTYGSVTIYLPRNFIGPIRTNAKYGTVEFSPMMTSQLTTFSERTAEGSYFLGPFTDSGFGDGENWKGDQLLVSSATRKIRVRYLEEDDHDRQSGKRPFWRSFF